MVKGHREFELLQAKFDFLLNLQTLDCNDLEHLLHVKDEIFKVIVFLHDFVDRQSDCSHSLASHVVHDLALLGNQVGYLDVVINFLCVLGIHFVLCWDASTLARC